MSDNPYNAPVTQDLVTSGFKRFEGGTGTFSIGKAFEEGKRATFANLGVLIGVLIVGFIIALVSAFTIIGYFLVIPVLMWGLTRVNIDAFDGQASFNTLFVGFKRYGSVLGRMLVLVLLMILISLPGMAIQIIGLIMESESIQMLGSLASIVYSLVVMTRLYFAIYFMIEAEQSATEALRSSWNATQSTWVKLIGFGIVVGIVAMSGVIALGVGLLVTVPLANLMYVSSFRQIVGRPVA